VVSTYAKVYSGRHWYDLLERGGNEPDREQEREAPPISRSRININGLEVAERKGMSPHPAFVNGINDLERSPSEFVYHSRVPMSTVMRGHRADAAIIPEPFGMKVVSATVGVQWCRIRVSGRGAHAEGASRALSAFDKSLYLIAALRQLEREWNSRDRRHPLYRRHRHPINFNVGMVQAGEWTSSVAQSSEVNVRLSCFPGESTEFLRTRTIECIGEAVRRDPWLRQNPPEVTFFGMRAEPAIFPTTGPFYTALAANHEIASGLPLQSAAVSASMDNRHFVEYGIPNFSYGPIGGNLHSSDEWLDLESLKTCTKTLAGVILDWCDVASKDMSDEGSTISLRQEA
jgi:acetylornithine deacetylase